MSQRTLEAQTFQDFEWLTEVGLKNRGFTFPHDMNAMLKRAKGDIIVSLQDCIELPADALECIHALHSNQRVAYTYPVGKSITRAKQQMSWDWRDTRPDDDITPNMWEIDLASAPIGMFFDIGGFDEGFTGWSWDNVEVGFRAEAAGYKFKRSRVTRGYAFDHDATEIHPFRDVLQNNDQLARDSVKRAQHGDYKLPYL